MILTKFVIIINIFIFFCNYVFQNIFLNSLQTVNMEYKIQKFSLAGDKNDPIINL